jgi:hypothetical protein
MYCYDSDPDPAVGVRTCPEDDEFFMIYEQDCSPAANAQYSFFVARFDLTTIGTPATHTPSNP